MNDEITVYLSEEEIQFAVDWFKVTANEYVILTEKATPSQKLLFERLCKKLKIK